MNRSVRELLRDYKEVAGPHGIRQSPASGYRPSSLSTSRPCFDSFVLATSDPFKRSWESIAQHRLCGVELANILKRIHNVTPVKSIYPLHKEHRQIMADHWPVWENPMHSKLSSLSAGHLAEVLGDIAGLRILPSETFLNRWFDAAEKKSGDFGSAQLAKSLSACAVLRKAPPYSFLASWYVRAITLPQSFNAHQACKAAWAAAVLHAKTNNPMYEVIFRHLKPTATGIGPSGGNDSFRKQIHDACLWFDGASPVANILREETKSRFEKDMVSRLRAVGFDIDTHTHPIPVLNKAIDFSLRKQGKWISFEIDGPTHFLHSTQTGKFVNDGRTLFRTALCRKQAPNEMIVRLPFDVVDDWMASSAKDQHGIMNFIVDETLAMGPGAYKVKYVSGEMVVDPMLMETAPRMLSRENNQPAPLYA